MNHDYANPYTELGAWYAGEKACYDGALRAACPHNVDSSNGRQWLQGFDEASSVRRRWEEANHERASA